MRNVFTVLGVIFALLLLLSCCSTTHLWSYYAGFGNGANTSRAIATQQGGGHELGRSQYSSGGQSSGSDAAGVACSPNITLTKVTVPLSEVGAVWTATGSSNGFSGEPWVGSNGYFGHYCQGKIRWQLEGALSWSDEGTVTLLVEARHWSNSDAAVEFLRRGSDSGGAVYGWSPTTKTPVILIGNGK